MRSRTIKTIVLLVFSVLTAAACTSSGEPDDYDDVVEENFMTACEEANERGEGEPEIDNIAEYCGCVYDAYEADVPYEEFKAIDDQLREQVEEGIIDGIDDLDTESQEILTGCIDETGAEPS